MSLSAPELLTGAHEVTAFDCGHPSLNVWLQRRAMANQVSLASRTFVVTDGLYVKGYYSLAAGSLLQAEATGKIRRNMPDPVPMALLGRLAIDVSAQGKGLGTALLKDSVLRVINASNQLAIRGILVDAIDVKAKTFYEHFGFRPSPLFPMKLMVTLADIERAVGGT